MRLATGNGSHETHAKLSWIWNNMLAQAPPHVVDRPRRSRQADLVSEPAPPHCARGPGE